MFTKGLPLSQKPASVARRREGSGEIFPGCGTAWRKSNPDCRHKRRQRVKICDTLPSTSTPGIPLHQYQSRCAGAGGAGGRREPPLRKAVELTDGGNPLFTKGWQLYSLSRAKAQRMPSQPAETIPPARPQPSPAG